MNYKLLKNRNIKVTTKEELEFDAGEGVVLVPPADSKIYIHWLNDKGKTVSTFTLAYSSLIKNKCKIINGGKTDVLILAITL